MHPITDEEAETLGRLIVEVSEESKSEDDED